MWLARSKYLCIVLALFLNVLVTKMTRPPGVVLVAISRVKSERLDMRIVLNVCGRSVKGLKTGGYAWGLVYS